MDRILRVVIADDSAVEAELAERELSRDGLSCHSFRVETREEFVEALEGFRPDVILAEYAFPMFNGMEALETAKRIAPWTPFLVVTDHLDDTEAVSFLAAGADDYVLKDRLARLGPAVRMALESRRIRHENDTALQSIRESEERYRRLFELESDAILLVDNSTGQVLDVNAAATRLYGYTRAEWLRMHHWDMSTEPEKTQQVTRQRLTWVPLRWHRKKDGRTFPVEVTCSHFDWRGRSVHVAAIRDISERVRAEEELRNSRTQLLEAQRIARVGSWRYSLGSRQVEWSHEMGRIFGIDPANGAPRYEEVLDLIHPEDRDRCEAFFNGATGSGEPKEIELRIVRPDGTVRHVVVRGENEADPEGRVVALYGTAQDITERRRLEEQLQQSQKMEAIGNLAGGVAHDFNNLLQAMLSVVQSLRVSRVDPEALNAQLAVLEDHIRRGAQFTRQLLLFSRREITAPETTDLNETVEATGQMLRRLLRENITLEFDLSRGRVHVQADRGQLEQVLMNLTLNAADAMPFGGDLVIRTGHDGDNVWIEVQDTGEGIPEAIRGRIFDPFFTTKPPGKGTGLGLSVVHGIVTSHGGAIRVDSEVGKGTKVRITLRGAVDGGTDTVVHSEPGHAYAPANEEKVLVVEDEEGARDGLRGILTVLGYKVQVAANAEEASNLDISCGFDVLLTDMMLPGVSGIELAGCLRERWPGLKVILMSGYTDEDLVRQGVQMGDFRFLQKPFGMTTLARVVRETLNGETRVGEEEPDPA